MIFGKHKNTIAQQKRRKSLWQYLRWFTVSCRRRHLSWLFIVIIASVTVWMVLLWYHLFQSEVLSQEDVERIRLKYAGTTFDAPAFRAVVERARERHAAFDAAPPHVARDIFFPKDYTPPKEKQ